MTSSIQSVSLLDLNDYLILEIIKWMSFESRLRLASLHPRLDSLVERSWLSLRKSPPFCDKVSWIEGSKFFEKYFPAILKCHNLQELTSQMPILTRNSALNFGRKLGTSCTKLRRLGDHYDLRFILGFVKALETASNFNCLEEVSISYLSKIEDVALLHTICEKSPHLKTVTIGKIPTRIFITPECLHLLENLAKRLDSLTLPMSLDDMGGEVNFEWMV